MPDVYIELPTTTEEKAISITNTAKRPSQQVHMHAFFDGKATYSCGTAATSVTTTPDATTEHD